MPNKIEEKVKFDYKKMFEELKKPLTEVYTEKGKDGNFKCVEKTDKNITKKGYDTTGYGYQFVVNRLNEVVTKYGLHWATQDEIRFIREYPAQSGKIQYEYAGKLTLLLLDDNRNAVDARACYGGHQSGTHADAMKGAFTNAFKKTAALFGVGADAYEGTIDEDYRPIEEPAIEPLTEAVMGMVLTGAEMKAVEKEITAIAGITNKEEAKNVENMITALVGKITGKQVAFLRRALENKVKEF